MVKIAIVGLGVIGSSLGLALKKSNKQNLQIIGFDAEVDVGNKATRLGAVDKAVWQLPDAVSGADVVIIATPVLAIREVMGDIAKFTDPGILVTDTGGTKTSVMDWAEEYLPSGVNFVGGDPLAGWGRSGVDNASPDLFRDVRYALVPGRNTTQGAVDTAVGLVEAVGAQPYFVDAFEHDSYMAAVNHLPVMLSTALVSAASKSPAWNEMSRMAASSFEANSSLAATDPIVNLDMCITNREGIVYWVNEAIRELARFRDLVSEAGNEDGAEALGQALAQNWITRQIWHTKYESGDFGVDQGQQSFVGTMGDYMGDFMIGGKLRDRYQQLFRLDEKKEKERERRRFRRK